MKRNVIKKSEIWDKKGIKGWLLISVTTLFGIGYIYTSNLSCKYTKSIQ